MTFNPSNFGSDLDIYCTSTSDSNYPSQSNGQGFARYAASDVYVGGTITKYAYRMFDSSTGNQASDGYANHEICINVSNNNTWEDLGESDPVSVTTVGTSPEYIKCTFGGGAVFYFENKSSWYTDSSGGGTSTEEVLVEDAKMVFYTGLTGWRFEQRGYAAGSYQLIGGTVNESWTVSSGSNNLQHHISQIPANGTYTLYSGSNVVVTLSTTSKKKVFCNFW